MLFKLYGIYLEQKPEESFDDFLFWGDIMLKDFDLIDRFLVDAQQLYRNTESLKELEDPDYSFLSDELKISLAKYWAEFAHKLSEGTHRQHFYDFWMSLGKVYERFSSSCREEGLVYEGLVYRWVGEHTKDLVADLVEAHEAVIGQGGVPYVFVGLFELSESELKLMSLMRERGVAEFVFDEEVCIIQDEHHPARAIFQRNKERIESASLKYVAGDLEDYLPRTIDAYACVSTMTQVKMLPTLLQSIEHDKVQSNRIDTAIILPDEQLLLPTVSSIPQTEQSLNITLGYPLNKTSIAIMLNRWMHVLASSYNGAYPTQELINLLTMQTLQHYYPALRYVVKALRWKKSFMLDGKWIVRTLLSEVRKSIEREQKEAVDCLSDLDRTATLLRCLLLQPEGSERARSSAETMRADEFLKDYLIKILNMLSECMVGELLQGQDQEPDAQGSEEPQEADLAEPNSSKARGEQLSFDLNFLKHYQDYVHRLAELVEQYRGYDMSRDSVMRLLDGLTQGHTIPFKGDPLQGLQIIGVLESRTLNFDHIIYLSAQEGKLPKSKLLQTFIPFNLRQAFGLPTPNEEDVYEAYRFYQTIARAKSLTLVYSLNDGLGGKGEVTRYLAQIEKLYKKAQGSQIVVRHHSVGSFLGDRHSQEDHEVSKKSEHIQSKLGAWLDGSAHLSASSFNMYLQCPMRFYYTYIEGLREEETADSLLQSNDFGSILHATLERIYNAVKHSSNGFVDTDTLRKQWEENRGRTHEMVRTLYAQQLEIRREGGARLSNYDEYNIKVIAWYVHCILKHDIHLGNFHYTDSEAELELKICLDDVPQPHSRYVYFKGYVDRIDEVRGVGKRIVDYKTGHDEFQPVEIEKMKESPSNYKAIIQTLLYCEMVLSGHRYGRGRTEAESPLIEVDEWTELYPALYITRLMAQDPESYSPYLSRDGKGGEKLNYMDIRSEYLSFVRNKLNELYNTEKAFVCSPDEGVCSYCPFTRLCRR